MVVTEMRYLIDRYLEIARITDNEHIRRENIDTALKLLEVMKNEDIYDASVQAYIKAMCHKTEKAKNGTRPKQLYGSYKAWCEEYGHRPVERLTFYRHIENAGFRKKLCTGYEYYNISIRSRETL